MAVITQKQIVVSPDVRAAALSTELNINIHQTAVAKNTSINSYVCYVVFDNATACEDIINA